MTFPDLLAFAVSGSFWRFLGVLVLITAPFGALANCRGIFSLKVSS
jgi:hypothetical protein